MVDKEVGCYGGGGWVVFGGQGRLGYCNGGGGIGHF